MSRHDASLSPARDLYDAGSRRRDRSGPGDSSRGRYLRSRSKPSPPRSRSRQNSHGRERRGDGVRKERRSKKDSKDSDRHERTRERDRDRKYAKEMAQQASLRMPMMMAGAMGNPMMQQGAMGNPMMMAAMQQQMMMMQQMAMGKKAKKSSKSSGSSSGDGGDEPSMPPMPPWMAMQGMNGMQGMFPPGMPPPPPPPGMYNDGSAPMDVESFLAANPVDAAAAARLRALPHHLQMQVLQRGPVFTTPNPSAVLIARIADSEMTYADQANTYDGFGGQYSSGYAGPSHQGPPPRPPPHFNGHSDHDFGQGSKGGGKGFGGSEGGPGRRHVKQAIEDMISNYRLGPGPAWMLRALPPDKQKLAARIDPAGQVDPSAYVSEQLLKIV